VEGAPKTPAGERPVALDRRTVQVLREHRRRQAEQRARRLAAGKAWEDSGYVFVRKDGSPIHPGYASGRFRLLVAATNVPPIRLHDLRHGAASLAHEAGADLKTLQDLLGHSSIVITADTYPACCPPPSAAAPTPPRNLCSRPPVAPATRSARKVDATGPTPARRQVLPGTQARPAGASCRSRRRRPIGHHLE
jgi:hypothetical protein